MSRMNSAEIQGEVRTHRLCNISGWLVGWSEKLIERCNSWFSPKKLSGLRRVFPLGVEHWKKRIGRKTTASIKLRIPEVIARQLDYGGEAPSVKRETAQIAI